MWLMFITVPGHCLHSVGLNLNVHLFYLFRFLISLNHANKLSKSFESFTVLVL